MRAENYNEPPIRLTQSGLSELRKTVSCPDYDRSALKPGIVHIGLGNFHRAHQAWYVHRLMQAGKAQEWAIIGAGVRPGDAEMRKKLQSQDFLTTLIELDPDETSAEISGAMVDFLPVEDGNGPLISAMSNPSVRIVSMTVTEGGYYMHPEGGIDLTHPDIAHDIASPETPRTVFGAIVSALKARRTAGYGPFTVMSCDNLQANGAIARRAVVSLARETDADLAQWIDEDGAFPNSMVDCIVPATGPSEVALAHAFGIDDLAPVTHENFRQWVLEDDFCAGRPPLEDAGVVMTHDVHSYEMMKLRILNGGHQLLANVGELLGLVTISESMMNPEIDAFFQRTQLEEIVPYVKPVPDVSADKYLRLVSKRFANVAIRDTNRRVAFDGSSRHPGFLLPSVRDALAEGGSVKGLALAEAFWARMCFGTREDGTHIEANDPNWSALVKSASEAREAPMVWLQQHAIYGDLHTTHFAEEFTDWLGYIWRHGSKAALEMFASSKD